MNSIKAKKTKELIKEPLKFDLHSLDIVAQQREKLQQLFPEAITESGKIDFDRLKLALGETVDTGKERYGMTWPGKTDCFKTIQKPSMATLVPAREESVNFDTTENLIIEGDNLEVLKLLQKSYLGKVKMIYIDPPYNTGNDFIYPDNYSESLDTYLRYTGQVDEEGRKFSTNTEGDGRFHSKWMNMMYPRLFLARNLLREDGVVFVSIDDHEIENLKKLFNEIFGEENFIACMPWKGRGGRQASEHLAELHEYIMCYARHADEFVIGEQIKEGEVFPKYDQNKKRKYKTQLLRKWGNGARRVDRPNMFYGIPAPDGTMAFPKLPDGTDGRWRWGKSNAQIALNNNDLEFLKEGDEWVVYEKVYEPKEGEYRTKKYTTWLDDVGTTAEGTNELARLFKETPFDFPKPTSLIKRLLLITGEIDDKEEPWIALDFFAGSGTTGEAILAANNLDGGRRKFILVQLPEPTERKDFPTIADITKERVRRVIKKLNDEDGEKLKLDNGVKSDHGFRVFKLQSSNFKAWNTEQPKDDAELTKQLTLHVDHLVEGRSQEDVLYELLLKAGFSLTTKIEKITLAGKSVFSIADGAMLICLEKELTPEVIKAMAEREPKRVVCLDAGFANNDQLKTNAVQTMKSKGVTKFQTV